MAHRFSTAHQWAMTTETFALVGGIPAKLERTDDHIW